MALLTSWFALVEDPPVTRTESELVLVFSWLCSKLMLKVELTIFLLLVCHLDRLPFGLAHGTCNEYWGLKARMAVVDLVLLRHGWNFGSD